MPRLSLSISIAEEDIQRFRADGFLIVPDVLNASSVHALRSRFAMLFDGNFETGVYPDEWYWRKELSKPDVTRHMANAWKSDLTIAQLALSPVIAQAAARLGGWSGTRLGQDTLWWKPPGARPVAHHQDTSFMAFFDPPQTVTCWVALDQTDRRAGTLEYVRGSHQWPIAPIPRLFHATDHYRAPMKVAARAAGVKPTPPTYVVVRAGSCAFHAGEIWHGSARNQSAKLPRRSIGLHFLPERIRFSDRPGGYIYRRYQRAGSSELDESFFPILWREDGTATSWRSLYLRTGRK